MKILIDHQSFTLQNYGGISRYFYNVYKHLSQDVTLGVLNSNNIYLKACNQQIYSIHLPKKVNYLLNHSYSTFSHRFGNFDILHPSYYDLRGYTNSKSQMVITVFDMIHELFPDHFAADDLTIRRKKEAIARADHIICISNNTKNDLLSFYNIGQNKISVIPLGSDPVFANKSLPPRDISKFSKEKAYILYVGSRSGYKNFSRYTEVFSRLHADYPNLRTICVGGGAFTELEQTKFKKFGLQKHMLQKDVSEKELGIYYSNALLLIYPSIYEGFGIPLIEAFNNLCPVVCSNSACFREIAGEAAIFFDPFDQEAMHHQLKNLLNDQSLRKSLADKGLKRGILFTWERTAKLHEILYKNLSY